MSAAFDVVFGVFVALVLGLSVVAVRWGVRRDRATRAEQAARAEQAPAGVPPSMP